MPPRHRSISWLEDPLLNKGTAFSDEERTELGLHGHVPPIVETLDEQVQRAYRAYCEHGSDLARHVNLRALQDTNETVFYKLLSEHVEEMLPIVYTPTVGLACQQFSYIYRRPRGLFLSYPNRGRLHEVLRSRRQEQIDVIVVTDGQRILGLGDQGVGGMGIPIGKLSLYSLLGGIDPARTLPIVLDVGTDNPDRLDDPLYLGWRHERIGDDDYYAFVDSFVDAIRAELPEVLLQWEDFATAHALPIIDRYRDELLTFNDDVQGTAAVAVGTLAGAAAATRTPMRDQRVVMLGAGSAGVGVAEQIVRAMVADGRSEPDARRRVLLVDLEGLLTQDRDDLSPAQRRVAQPPDAWPHLLGADLHAVVAAVHPTALLGLSTAQGAFTREVVTTMAAHVDQPIVMPLSNPNHRSEADPQDLADWTAGRALVATGSPFPPMRTPRGEVPVAQCNNVYAFPGIGLGVVAGRATRVTDGMLTAAAEAIAAVSPVRHDPRGALLPKRDCLDETALSFARAVARRAVVEGAAPEQDDQALERVIERHRWTPRYRARTSACP